MLLLEVLWDVSPTIFKIGPVEVRWYGLCFALAFMLGFLVMQHIFKTEHKSEKDLDSLLLTMMISTVLGARLGHYIFYQFDDFIARPWEALIPPFAGLASHGAVIGILTGLWLYVRKHQDQAYLWVTDRIAIVAALAGSFIRFGNLMNSEIVGKPTDVAWAFNFLQNYEFEKVPRHPSQLYESLSCLVLFGLLFWLWNRWKDRTPDGILTAIFLIWVFVLRFFYEFLKENQDKFEDALPLNMGQILSIPVVLFGIFILFRVRKGVTTSF